MTSLWDIFRKKERKELHRIADKVEKKSTIEIVAHKKAQQEVLRKAHRVNRDLKELIEENGFHVAIYLATGGKLDDSSKQSKDTK